MIRRIVVQMSPLLIKVPEGITTDDEIMDWLDTNHRHWASWEDDA